ncbi:hypothetical protein BGZ63DRAFT_438282 [Mariannaea sp. PMI_226]|nr:hypothetical protein BGZ63DRAFT_438282 [Mariannaea sp. PMI_226]
MLLQGSGLVGSRLSCRVSARTCVRVRACVRAYRGVPFGAQPVKGKEVCKSGKVPYIAQCWGALSFAVFDLRKERLMMGLEWLACNMQEVCLLLRSVGLGGLIVGYTVLAWNVLRAEVKDGKIDTRGESDRCDADVTVNGRIIRQKALTDYPVF